MRALLAKLVFDLTRLFYFVAISCDLLLHGHVLAKINAMSLLPSQLRHLQANKVPMVELG